MKPAFYAPDEDRSWSIQRQLLTFRLENPAERLTLLEESLPVSPMDHDRLFYSTLSDNAVDDVRPGNPPTMDRAKERLRLMDIAEAAGSCGEEAEGRPIAGQLSFAGFERLPIAASTA